MIINPYKHIEIEIIKKTPKYTTFFIKEQTHTIFNFGGGDRIWYCKQTGFRLQSFAYPEFYYYEDALCVRGSNECLNNTKIRVRNDKFDLIQKTINLYNEEFCGAKENITDRVFYATKRRNIINAEYDAVKDKKCATLISDLI
jgi:hypothetical protein